MVGAVIAHIAVYWSWEEIQDHLSTSSNPSSGH